MDKAPHFLAGLVGNALVVAPSITRKVQHERFNQEVPRKNLVAKLAKDGVLRRKWGHFDDELDGDRQIVFSSWDFSTQGRVSESPPMFLSPKRRTNMQ